METEDQQRTIPAPEVESNTASHHAHAKTVDQHDCFTNVLEQLNRLSNVEAIEEVICGILDLMIVVSESASAIFYFYEPDTDEFVVTAVRGDSQIQNLVGIRLKKHQGMVGGAVSGTDPLIIGELFSDPNWLRAIFSVRPEKLENVLLIPLQANGSTFGAVQLIGYTLAAMGVLKALGARLVLEIERISALSSEHQYNERLSSLIEMLGKNGCAPDRNTLLQLVTEEAARLVSAERSSIFLVDANNRDIGQNISYQSTETEADQEQTGSANSAMISSIITRRWKHIQRYAGNGSGKPFGFTTRSAVSVPLRIPDHAGGPGRVIGGLMALNKYNGAFDDVDMQLLEILADQTGALLHISEVLENANELYLDVIKAMVASLDAKDPYTQGHSLRVFEYAVALAQGMNLSPEMISDIRIASLLHDVGKIGIADEILKKKGTLTKEEYEIMKKHPVIGGNIMRQVRVLETVIPGIVEHHERIDGSGYPLGLKGEQISLMGRIIAIADVYDAMTSNRPYRMALSSSSVLEYLQKNAGKLFDAATVQVFAHVIAERSSSARA